MLCYAKHMRMLYGNHRTEPTNVQQPRCAIRFRETTVVCLWAVGSWCDVIHAISSEVRQSAYSLAGCRAEAASGETAGPSHYHSRPLQLAVLEFPGYHQGGIVLLLLHI